MPAGAACGPALGGTCIELTVPASLALGTTLAPGQALTSAQQSIQVSSNAAWGLKVSSDRADGRMTEWNGSAYLSRQLTNPLEWALTSLNGVAVGSPVYASVSSTAATVITGRAATTCGIQCAVETHGVRYRLTPSFQDPRVSPNSYRISLTYDARHGF